MINNNLYAIMSKRGFFMEKAEMITELYNLRSALFLIDVVYKPIFNKEAFEFYWYEKKNWNTWDTMNRDITYLRLESAPLFKEFDPSSNLEWDFWGNIYQMYYLNSQHPYFKAIERNMRAYHLLFDWLFDNKMFIKEYGAVYKSAGLTYEERDRISSFFSIVNSFRYSNINVLKNSLAICEDALVNKKSRLLKYYNRRQIERRIIPGIQDKIRTVQADIDNGETFTRVRSKYGITQPRTEEEVDSDNRKLKEMQEALELIKQQYTLIDSRDWQNIDSVIYLLETGRADTIKEALNLADTKKYRQDILGAVNSLNRTMVRGFGQLLANLDFYFGKLFENLGELKMSIDNVADTVQDLAIQLQVSSEEIAESVKSIERRVFR